ncbi:type VII secretion protein EccB [Virgisporangium ochraceum]|uniref:Type VII secretion protein EccB n=2 Tax=Virgisporangium ochraceum TaxID=65505 RepID=A0A8J3ZLW6_9ACTN|nr:type VII secretion protein EccB [Virgisporangium ochraceum]
MAAHESNPSRPPGRRAGLALLAGVLAAALGLAGFAVWGLLQPGGSTKWRSGSAVIVEKESGAKFVYLDGVLHPVANYASALLIVGAAKTMQVARRSLAGAPRGPLLGIPGAPDALPRRRDLLAGPWAVCGSVGSDRSTVVVGSAPRGDPLGADGALVSTPDGAVHLLWQGRRARVREPETVLGMLVWGTPAPVAPAVVNALAAAADIGRVPVPGRGQPFGPVPGARIGQVFLVDGRQHAVALAAGLAPTTAFQAALVLGDPATVERVGQTAPTALSPGEYARLPRTAFPGSWIGLPDEVPRPVRIGAAEAVCASSVPGGEVVVSAAQPRGAPIAGSAPGLASEVRLPPGRGVLATARAAPGAEAGVVYLVTDLGVRYPLASSDVLPMLGFSGARPVPLPAEVLALLPTGPGLYPQDARRVVGS